MALQGSFSSGNFGMELRGRWAGHLASCEIGSLKADSVDMPAASDYITKKSIGNLEYGSCSATIGMSECQTQIEWISSIWNKNIIEEVKWDDLDANNNKKPYQMTYKFAPESLKFLSGTGAQLKGDLGAKQKAWNPANFRIKMGGLPCERITKLSGMAVTSEVAKEYHGQFRTPMRHQSNIKFGDITIEVSGDEKTFTEWNKYATLTLQDGVCQESEELVCTIEWLSPDLKTPLGEMTLMGCGLKEFKFGPKFEHNKSAMSTFTCVFNVEDIRFKPSWLA